MTESRKLASYAYRYAGSWSKIAKAAADNEPEYPCTIKDSYITILDDSYPDELRALRYPPWVLFYRGNRWLLYEPKITIVGSRSLSDYGCELTITAADILKKRFVLVSGLARGADSLVHKCALEGGHSIGVTGCGLDTVYPGENRYLYEVMSERDLILSEYPSYVKVKKEHFPWRNRILAALGQSLVVTAAKEKSGTMLTVNEAAALGRDIYTFPWPFGSLEGQGCSHLIADGAEMIYSKDQLREIRPK